MKNIGLPDSWAVTSLSQCAMRITDGTHLPPNFVESGVPFLFVKHIVKGQLTFDDTKFISEATWQQFQNRCPVELNDVLYTAVGSYGVAVVVHTDRRFSFQRHIAHIKPHGLIDSRFLAYFLNSPFGVQQAHRVARGVAQKTVTLGDLKQFNLNLAPLNEQRRIVARIEELFSDLDAGVAALKRAKANLKRYRASVLKAAVVGKLTEEWRASHPAKEPASALLARILKERRQKWEADQLTKFATAGKEPPKNWREKYVDPVESDSSELQALPVGWCWASLDSLLSEPLRNGHSAKATGDGSGVRTLTLSAVTYGEFTEANIKHTMADPLEVDDLWIEPGDILVERSNTPELVGTARLFSGPPRFAIFPDLLIRVRVSPLTSVAYCGLFLQAPLARRYFQTNAKGLAGSMPKIDQATIMRCAVPLPPGDEQAQIAEEVSERMSQIDAAETQIEHGLLRAARLRQSILKQAFEGKLVPQDPAEEPARVLLERLRAGHKGDGDVQRDEATPRRPRSGRTRPKGAKT